MSAACGLILPQTRHWQMQRVGPGSHRLRPCPLQPLPPACSSRRASTGAQAAATPSPAPDPSSSNSTYSTPSHIILECIPQLSSPARQHRPAPSSKAPPSSVHHHLFAPRLPQPHPAAPPEAICCRCSPAKSCRTTSSCCCSPCSCRLESLSSERKTCQGATAGRWNVGGWANG